MRIVLLTAFLGICFLAGFFVAESERPPHAPLARVFAALRAVPVAGALFEPATDPPEDGGGADEIAWGADGERPHWFWFPAPDAPAGGARDGAVDSLRAARGKLDGLAYLGAYESGGGLRGVTRHDPAHTAGGLNFFTTGASASAFLMDMDGRTLHRWRLDYAAAFPDETLDTSGDHEFWFHARLFPGGDVIALYTGNGIVRIDRDSNPIWALTGDFHHHFDYDDSTDTILVLNRGDTIPAEWSNTDSVIVERIIRLDAATGSPVDTLSLSGAIDRSHYRSLVEHTREFDLHDKLHPNTLEILDGRFADRHPAFRRGNILTSLRNIDTIGIVDPASGSLVWALAGGFDYQHRPVFRDDGTISRPKRPPAACSK